MWFYFVAVWFLRNCGKREGTRIRTQHSRNNLRSTEETPQLFHQLGSDLHFFFNKGSGFTLGLFGSWESVGKEKQPELKSNMKMTQRRNKRTPLINWSTTTIWPIGFSFACFFLGDVWLPRKTKIWMAKKKNQENPIS